MQWRAFRYGEDTYDLCHLHPKTITYVQEAKGDKPARAYAVEVHFSLHCFTRGFKPDQIPDPALLYSDDREVRIFDAYRWRLSHNLPRIVEGLMGRKCFHTGYGNFLTVEILNPQDRTIVKYEVFFEVSRSTRRGILNLFIQSAYVREGADAGKRRHNPRSAFLSFFTTLSTISRSRFHEMSDMAEFWRILEIAFSAVMVYHHGVGV